MFIGTTVLSEIVFDRGAQTVLEDVLRLCHVNAVLVYANTFTRRMYVPSPTFYRRERNAGLFMHPGNGKVVDENFVRSDPPRFRDLAIQLPKVEDSAFQGRDVIDEMVAAAEGKGVAVSARILEPYRDVGFIPGLDAVHEVSADGRPSDHACLNHPDYVRWVLAMWEDVLRNHPRLAGLKYGQERGAPLLESLRGRAGYCFCEHCARKAADQGLDLEHARPGWQELTELGLAARAGQPRPGQPRGNPGGPRCPAADRHSPVRAPRSPGPSRRDPPGQSETPAETPAPRGRTAYGPKARPARRKQVCSLVLAALGEAA